MTIPEDNTDSEDSSSEEEVESDEEIPLYIASNCSMNRKNSFNSLGQQILGLRLQANLSFEKPF